MRFLLLLAFVFLFNSYADDDSPSWYWTKESKIKWLVKKQLDDMVKVKGGTFMMGDPGSLKVKTEDGYPPIATEENRKKYPNAKVVPVTGDDDNIPSHKVTLSDFSMAAHLVTWQEFDVYYSIIGKDKYDYSSTDTMRRSFFPAWAPSWQEARGYCRFLAKHSGINFDLPTEAQWEYAARSEGKYVYFATDNGRGYDEDEVRHYKAYKHKTVKQNMSGNYHLPGGSFPPNPLGLYDMSDSGWQWVKDWYAKDYYAHSPKLNPQGPENGKKKVIRGGDTFLDSVVYNRYYSVSDNSLYFRCVINP